MFKLYVFIVLTPSLYIVIVTKYKPDGATVGSGKGVFTTALVALLVILVTILVTNGVVLPLGVNAMVTLSMFLPLLKSSVTGTLVWLLESCTKS